MMLNIPANTNFNPDLAQELLLLVEQAHREFDRSNSDPTWNWDADRSDLCVHGKTYKIKLRFGFAEFFFDPGNMLNTDVKDLGNLGRDRVPFGFIAHDEHSNSIYVAFRGTVTPAEWIINFQFKPGSEPFLGRADLGSVHRGFYKIYSRADRGANPFTKADNKPPMMEAIEKALTGSSPTSGQPLTSEDAPPCPADAQVYVTGHSLGGALATLSTLHIKEMHYFQSPPILYAFANPRAGGETFFKQFQGLDCFRIANSEDIVPTLPLASIDLTSDADDATSNSLRKIKPPLLSTLLADLDYQHIGEPLYFTLHKGAIADNHIIPAYKEALGLG